MGDNVYIKLKPSPPPPLPVGEGRTEELTGKLEHLI